jgi:ABC-2 type transport system ATP-binding protein
MIDASGLTKRFGDKVAVDDLSFTVRSGLVTGFLGPNGAGKSTTIRVVLGLDRPTKGRARVNGRTYRSTKAPMTEVGALLDSKSVHPGRSARGHLRALAATHGIPVRRVDELIELVGLADVAGKRVGEFSQGMGQRLGLAVALLGDPQTLILDEPINGLDPEGVAWVRGLLRHLASEGRTVFLSSHLMSEMALTADHIIIIGRGRLIADSPMSDLIEQASGMLTMVRSPHASQIVESVIKSGRSARNVGDGTISIRGLTAQAIGEEASRRGWILHELTPIHRSLEDIYLELTNSAQEFHTASHWDQAPPQEIKVEPHRDTTPRDELPSIPPAPETASTAGIKGSTSDSTPVSSEPASGSSTSGGPRRAWSG